MTTVEQHAISRLRALRRYAIMQLHDAYKNNDDDDWIFFKSTICAYNQAIWIIKDCVRKRK